MKDEVLECNTTSKRISTLISALVYDKTRSLKMPDEINKCYHTLHNFMYDAVYKNPVAKSEEQKAQDIIKYLYEY